MRIRPRVFRFAAALAALALLASCGIVDSVTGKADEPAARSTAPARPADARAGLPAPAASPAMCVPEGGSCRERGTRCCDTLVCVGIGSSFCMNRN